MSQYPQNPATCVCGTFETPTTPDQGRCFPYREKRDCEAPVLPVPPCADEEYTTVYDPDSTPPFRVLATLRDENCEIITDENGDPIITTIS